MNTIKRINPILGFVFIIILSGCCQLSNTCGDDGVDVSTSPNYYYVWLTTSQDAYVDDRNPDAPFNTFSLNINHGLPNGEHRTYLQFFIPQFPEGTEVLEAYINVFEDSQQNNGTQSISVREASEGWNSSTITWNNQPTPPGMGIYVSSIKAFEGVNKWRGSDNIKLKAKQFIENPSSHYGFILDNVGPYNLTRSFTSMNSPRGRTETKLDQCPRFLLKLKSDVPLTPQSIGTTVTGSNEFDDLYGTGTEFLVYKIETGDNWPPSWEIDTQ